MAGIYLKTVSLDDIVQGDEEIIIVNDIDTNTDDGFNTLTNLLYSIYDSDKTPDMPTCACGKYYGEYRKNTYFHQECGTYVKDRGGEIKPILAIRSFSKDLLFILPDTYAKLKKILTKGRSMVTGLSILDYMINPSYDWEKLASPTAKKNVINKLLITEVYNKVIEGNRSYQYFVNNYEEILKRLIMVYKSVAPTTLTADKLSLVLEDYLRNKDKVFNQYLLLPNKIWLSMEKTPTGRWINQSITPVLSAASMAMKLNNPHTAPKITVAILDKLVAYINDVDSTQLDKKPGLLRKHVYGTRMPFSYRSVITSKTDGSDFITISAPWAYTLKALRPHMINYLVNRKKYNYQAAVAAVRKDQVYNKDIDDGFKFFIESYQSKGYKGIPITTNRNPSIKNGSISPVFIDVVKPCVDDLTQSLHAASVKPFNADFDGDEMTNVIVGDHYMAELVQDLSPYRDILSDTYPRQIDGLYIPSPIVSIINNYLDYEK